MHKCRINTLWVSLVVLCLCLEACSKQTALNPVTGKVVLNNQPLGGAKVLFHPESSGVPPTDFPAGTTSSDGTFSVTTGGRPGAPAGKYKVSIVCLEVAAAKTAKGEGVSMSMGEEVDRLKGAYSNPETSKLSAEVKEGSNELEPFVLQ